jgi:hypothetical protein
LWSWIADQRQRSRGRHHPVSCVDIILQNDRYTVERPARTLPLALIIQLPCDLKGIRIDFDDRIKCRTARVDRFDAAQVALNQLDRIEPPGFHRRLKLGDGYFF